MHRSALIAGSPKYFAATILVLLAIPLPLHAQCLPIGAAAAPPVHASGSSPQKPEFFEQPSFTVSGVTDTTGLGGHASGMGMHPRTLSKDVAALSDRSPQLPSAANEESLRQAAARDPKNFDANFQLGRLLVQHGKPAEALPYLERAAALRPHDFDTGYELAAAYAGSGNYQRAQEGLHTLIAGNDKSQLHHLLADVEEKSGNPLAAVGEYQRAADLEPSQSNLFDWASELLEHNAVEPAIQVFTKGNRLFPQSLRMLLGLGAAFYERGSYDEAAGRFCQASDLDPAAPTPYFFLGRVEAFTNYRSENIASRLARFVTLRPDNAMAHYYYGLALRPSSPDAGNTTPAEMQLRRAVELDPRLAEAYLQLGVLYSGQKNRAQAISAYEKATQADPQMDEAHYRLALAYRQNGEPLKAEKEIGLYRQTARQKEQKAEQDRRQVQQFVYTLRGPGSAPD